MLRGGVDAHAFGQGDLGDFQIRVRRSAPRASSGIPTSTVVASGLSTAFAPSAVTLISGLKGTFSHPVAPVGVV